MLPLILWYMYLWRVFLACLAFIYSFRAAPEEAEEEEVARHIGQWEGDDREGDEKGREEEGKG